MKNGEMYHVKLSCYSLFLMIFANSTVRVKVAPFYLEEIPNGLLGF